MRRHAHAHEPVTTVHVFRAASLEMFRRCVPFLNDAGLATFARDSDAAVADVATAEITRRAAVAALAREEESRRDYITEAMPPHMRPGYRP